MEEPQTQLKYVSSTLLSHLATSRLDQLVIRANLPKSLPWGPQTRVRDFMTGGYADRFNDGKIEVRIGDNCWTFDSNVTLQECGVKWLFTVREDGLVTATPRMNTRRERGPEPVLASTFGLDARILGSIGEIAPLFPEEMNPLLKPFGIPCMYGLKNEVMATRGILVEGLTK